MLPWGTQTGHVCLLTTIPLLFFQTSASDFRPEAPLYSRTHRGYVDPTERCLFLSTHGIMTPTEDLVWTLAVSMCNLRLALRRPRGVPGPGGTTGSSPQVDPPKGQEDVPQEAQMAESPASPSPELREVPSPAPGSASCGARSEGSSPPRGAPYTVGLQMSR